MTEPLTVEQVQKWRENGEWKSARESRLTRDWLRQHAELEAKDAEIERLDKERDGWRAIARGAPISAARRDQTSTP